MSTWLEKQPADLAGILALFPNAGAQHGFCDVARVGALTLLVFDDGDVGTSQGMRQAHCGDSSGGCEPEHLSLQPHHSGQPLGQSLPPPIPLPVTIATAML